MSQHVFKRNRGPLRFKPAHGLATPKPGRAAAAILSGKPDDKPDDDRFPDRRRQEAEIGRAENLAAGLPADSPESPEEPVGTRRDRRFRRPEPRPRAGLDAGNDPEEPDTDGAGTPEAALKPPAGLLDKARSAVREAVRKVRQLIEPEPRRNIEVIINAEPLETRVAVLEESRLNDFTVERTNTERLVGSVYKGKVRNLEDGLKAAFVDIGFDKNAFLHYWDIIPSPFDSSIELVEREDRKRARKDKPKITTKDVPRLYPVGSEIIVQVTKGPIGTKGPRVTTNLALPGRYLVLLPNSEQCGISRKIEDPAERQRLKKILRELTLPEGMGVIIRTAGEDKLRRYFIRDLALLLEEWKRVQDKTTGGTAPCCVFQEPDLIERTVRDFLTEDVDRIIIDDHKQFQRVQDLIGRISRRSAKKIAFYNEAEPLFDRYNITRQLEQAFGRQVTLKSGGYLIIDETEALVAIDVNTGRHKGSKDHDQNLLKVNLEAADEICRQLRLRNMGGIIVLDFIDMKSRKDQQTLYQRMKGNLRRDRAKTHILPLSQLGLMEMTRQRHTESVADAMLVDCPHCRGRGVVKSPESMSVEIQRKLTAIMKARPRDESDFQLRIHCHPAVLERLRTQDERLLIELEKKFYAKLAFRPEPAFHNEQWRIMDAITNVELGRSAA
ncbi:MAG: Rne/Rng family ribonuclease [Verrucomicrobiae bacterium]|nr:Rne/Rng family ribonuclease [Verrucomicrobiae bacterium]